MQSDFENKSGIAGTWLFIECVKHLNKNKISGDIAEFGAFECGNVNTFLESAPSSFQKRRLHVFDSFEGFPKLSEKDPSERSRDFKDNDYLKIKKHFQKHSKVKIHKGFFSETLNEVKDTKFAMIYYDADLYEPLIEVCETLYENMDKGAILLFHDCYSGNIELPPGASKPFTGVIPGVLEFFKNKNFTLHKFEETTHWLVIKN